MVLFWVLVVMAVFFAILGGVTIYEYSVLRSNRGRP
jgi:hypothetical protein